MICNSLNGIDKYLASPMDYVDGVITLKRGAVRRRVVGDDTATIAARIAVLGVPTTN